MLSFLAPLVVTVLRLVAPAPSDARLELTAIGLDARRVAAEVLVDADAVVDLVLVDHAAAFEVELAGERHELRIELDDEGAVIGAALWWLGEAEDDLRYDLAAALPALEDSGTLDAIRVGDEGVVIVAGRVTVPLRDGFGEDLEDVDGDGDEEWGC